MSRRSKVILIDDDLAVLDALREMVLSLDLDAECFSSSTHCLDTANFSEASCLVSDYKMPRMCGLGLLAKLRRRHIYVPVILVTGYGDMPLAVNAMKLGAMTCLEKPLDPLEFAAAIEGAQAKSDGKPQGLSVTEAQAALAQLTECEQQVLRGIAAGLTNLEIAARLDLSPRTIQFRRSDIKRKLEVRSRADMARLLQALALTPDFMSPAKLP
jgi:two-component system, LuxR family, response regulator FixJ